MNDVEKKERNVFNMCGTHMGTPEEYTWVRNVQRDPSGLQSVWALNGADQQPIIKPSGLIHERPSEDKPRWAPHGCAGWEKSSAEVNI